MLVNPLPQNMHYRGRSFTKNNSPLALPLARENAISRLVAVVMNSTDCLGRERSPRRQVPPRRASCGSNPVTPSKMSVDVFSLVLKSSKTGRRYVGSCADIADRLRRHNCGESPATKHGLPWTLIYEEQFPTRARACARERYFKTGRGRDELNRLSI